MVVLSDGVAMFQGIGEQMAGMQSEFCQRFFVFSNSQCRSQLGHKAGQSRGRSVGMHVDLTLLHSCTFVSLVTEWLSALDHSSNAFALAQG